MVRPLSPNEVTEAKKAIMPDFVIEAFNHLIAKNFTGRSSKILQKDVIAHMLSIRDSISRDEIYQNHWLDVEDIYRSEGWEVEYDKPVAWGGENFEAYYRFTKK